jgi:hypothetical protein
MALKFKKAGVTEGTAVLTKEMKKGQETTAETSSQETVALTEGEDKVALASDPNTITADQIAVKPKKSKTKAEIPGYGVTVQGDEVHKPEGTIVPAQQCEVGVDASYTHNLGNYQSCRIGVSLKVPCSIDEINGVYTMAKDWVDTRMSQLREELED